jgi:hypothetical protein
MLSIFGSKTRILQAHMCPDSLRLQMSYSEFYDWRDLTQEWLDVFVRWFLSEPLAVPTSLDEEHDQESCDDSDELDECLVAQGPEGELANSHAPKVSHANIVTGRTPSGLWVSPRCLPEGAARVQPSLSPRSLLSVC